MWALANLTDGAEPHQLAFMCRLVRGRDSETRIRGEFSAIASEPRLSFQDGCLEGIVGVLQCKEDRILTVCLSGAYGFVWGSAWEGGAEFRRECFERQKNLFLIFFFYTITLALPPSLPFCVIHL